MRETVVIKVEWYEDDYDNSTRERLIRDGVEVMHVGPLSECPEDAILERDLIGPSDFVNLFESIINEHNGKQIKFEHEEVEEF